MKKCPFFITIIITVGIIAVYGLLIKNGLVYAGTSMENASNDSKTIEVASAVHFIKSSIASSLGIGGDDYPEMDDIMLWTPPEGTVSADASKDEEDDSSSRKRRKADLSKPASFISTGKVEISRAESIIIIKIPW